MYDFKVVVFKTAVSVAFPALYSSIVFFYDPLTLNQGISSSNTSSEFESMSMSDESTSSLVLEREMILFLSGFSAIEL